MARIYRDAYGVPHVRATSVLDLARGQGLVTARDRAWQLEYLRRRATGTAAEVLGGRLLGWDVLARRTRMAETAQRAFDNLGAEAQGFVAAYVEGVNAGLHADAPELTELGIAPEPWEPWTPLAVFHAQHLLFAALPDKLWQHRARTSSATTPGSWRATAPSPPAATRGRSAGGVRRAACRSSAATRTGSSSRPVSTRRCGWPARTPTTRSTSSGSRSPASPASSTSRTPAEVAWAITNACADYQDVFEESLDDVVEQPRGGRSPSAAPTRSRSRSPRPCAGRCSRSTGSAAAA